MTPPRARLVTSGLLVAVATMTGCASFTRVDAPPSFRADRRLALVGPKDGRRVQSPVTIRWKVHDFPLTGGNHFGVFIDRAALGQRKYLRWRLCAEKESLPPQTAELRGECHDDRLKVFMASGTSVVIPCVDPIIHAPKKRQNDHTVTVILLDGQNRRVGGAAARGEFKIITSGFHRCPVPSIE